MDDFIRFIKVQAMVRRFIARRRYRKLVRQHSELFIIKLQARMRGFVARHRWRKLAYRYLHSPEAKDLRHRNELLREILSSEKNYLHHLEILYKVYYKPIKDSASKDAEPILTNNQITDIFYTFQIILSISTVFTNDLEKKMDKWPTVQIGECFLKIAPLLKVYSGYINNYNNAITAIETAKKGTKFTAFLDKTKNDVTSMKETEGRDLNSYLIMPIQRIPRYALLLKDLVKFTLPEHVDLKKITEALVTIEKIAKEIDENKREHENMKTVIEIQNTFNKEELELEVVLKKRLALKIWQST